MKSKKEICEIGRRIYMNGFVAANDGNISVKLTTMNITALLPGFPKAL